MVWTVVLIPLGSGLVNFLSVIYLGMPEHEALLRELFSIEFFYLHLVHLSRFFTLFIGFALVISSLYLSNLKTTDLLATQMNFSALCARA